MAMLGGGRIAPLGGAIKIIIPDNGSIDLVDTDGFTKFSFKPNGDLHMRGGVRKI